MDAPNKSDWVENDSNKETKDSWTEDCQGVAWDGQYWIFSNNSKKKLYVFSGEIGEENIIHQYFVGDLLPYKMVRHLGDHRHINYVRVYHDLEGPLDHVGQLCFYNGCLYVSHFNDYNSHILVFKDNNGNLEFNKIIKLEKTTLIHEFQAINPWDGRAYTCFGQGIIDRLFIHYLNDENGIEAGKLVRENGEIKTLNLLGRQCIVVQGAAFSPNGHVYIACHAHLNENENTRFIRYYSALNGDYLGDIVVPAEHDWHEQEGICCQDLTFRDGHRAQIFSILLNNIYQSGLARPSIWFKHFCASNPDIV